MDPVTALAIASTAFTAIKRGISIGNDIESMTSDISRWMGAISTIREAEQKVKNPSLFKSFFAKGSIEQEAIEVFAAKKKAEAMERELKTFVNFEYGPSAWNEILFIQSKIRKERQAERKRQEELKQNFLIYLITFVAVLIICTIGVFIYVNT